MTNNSTVQPTRKAQSTRNLIFGLFYQVINIVVSFVLKTVVVYVLGDAVNGLNGLFTEVIAILSMAELGIGTAIVYNLYRPLAENDEDKLCQLMTLFRKAYTIIAAAVMVLALLIAPFIQYLVKEVPFSNGYIRIIFLLFALKTASSYLFSYKTSLLGADQKNYIPSIVDSISRIFAMILGIIVIKVVYKATGNVEIGFAAYMIVLIVMTLLTNIGVSVIADKRYPFLKRSAELPKDERKKVFSNIKNLFIGRLSGRITNSTDNILISVMVSTLVAGYYSVYSMLLNAVRNVFIQAQSAVAGSMGNMMVSETDEHCARLFSRLTFLFFIGGSVCVAALYSVATDFVEMVYPPHYALPAGIVFICALNLFIFVVSAPLWQIMTASGLFKWDKDVSILGSVVNLVVSVGLGLLLEKVFHVENGSLIGIFLGTTCTRIIQTVLKIQLLYTKRLPLVKQKRQFYADMLIMTLLTCAQMWLGSLIADKIVVFTNVFASKTGLLIDIVIRAAVVAIIALVLDMAVYFRRDEFKYSINLIKSFFAKIKQKKEAGKVDA